MEGQNNRVHLEGEIETVLSAFEYESR